MGSGLSSLLSCKLTQTPVVFLALRGRGAKREELLLLFSRQRVSLFCLLYFQDPQDEKKTKRDFLWFNKRLQVCMTLLFHLILCSHHYYILVFSLSSLLLSAHKCIQKDLFTNISIAFYICINIDIAIDMDICN